MLSDVTPRHAPWSPEVALETIGAHAGLRGPLLPVLHALQETFGYVDPRAVPLVAMELNLSRAEVYGLLTFYPDLRSTPPGKVRVQVCRGEACQSVGGHALAQHATSSLGVDFGGTTADGSVTLDEVFCLGNCALGPTVTVAGRLHGRVLAADLDRLLSNSNVNNADVSGELT
ncbi:MAG TPA: NAD(P)H-dependent oxidoreductase subunit E [Dermatophilaceae bacterium]|nr:NAD(P)H-dependent oxidoreductase subunit E [Dermatophilaceae bacterium]